MKASDLFVKVLENEGVEYVFGVPGEENLDLVESLRTSKIKLIITRHEQAAGFMAATYGRLTGKAGVCLSTLGPGATNLVTAAAYATLGGMPMLMITGQKPIKKSKQGRFQIVDIVDMMRPLTKFTKQIVNGNTIPSLLRESFRLAEQERPGAVHLELPEDIAHEDTDEPIFDIVTAPRSDADIQVILKAVEMISNAKMPLILIGAGGNRKLTSKALKALIDKTDIPFFNTQMGKGVIDERHPLFLGTAALSSGDYVHCAIDRADLIINVGHDVIEKPPFFMEHNGKKVIHINFFPAIVDEVYFPNLEVIGDIANSVYRITENITPQTHWNLQAFLNIKKETDRNVLSGSDDDRFPLLPQRLVSDVRKALPSDAILTLDNGMYKIWFARNYIAHQSNGILLDNALATMGAGLPSAIAASMIYPNRQIVAVCGDGGFMMNAQELETAVRLQCNLVILILRDDAYGMIKWKQGSMGFADFGLEFGNPDFVAFAQCHGARGHRLENAQDFVELLKNCAATPGVDLIDIPIDYSETGYELGQKLKEKICAL